jgi:hypothetical protein
MMQEMRLTQRELDSMLEYSSSYPTGTTPGKRWKRRDGTGWVIGEYDPADDGKGPTIAINWYRPIVAAEDGGGCNGAAGEE